MKRLSVALTAAALLLAGCSSSADAPETALQDAYGLTGMTAPEIIDHLDTLDVAERPETLMASIQGTELLLADDAENVTLDLPADRFYLSVAPYVDQTHECFHHSLTTCKGELADTEVQVRVVDDATGEVLVDEALTTFDNGFLGLWLPRDVEGTVEVTADGRTGAVPFSTAADAATCLTTLRLV